MRRPSDGTWVYVITYKLGGAGTGCPAVQPGDNIAANGSISKSSTTITVQNLSNYPWVANLGDGTGCSGCIVTDTSVSGSPEIGTISSWTGTTITLKAKAKNAGKSTSDTLLIQSPNTKYDSPTGTSVSQWSPVQCDAEYSFRSGEVLLHQLKLHQRQQLHRCRKRFSASRLYS